MNVEAVAQFSVFTLGALISILNPIGILPQFITFTRGLSREEKIQTATRASFVAGIFILACSLLGRVVFDFFGITLPAFKLAGGILLLLIALDMLRAARSRAMTTPEEYQEGVEREDISIFPVAIPLIAGPGSITVALILGERAEHPVQLLVVGASLLLCMTGLFFCLREAGRIADYLGRIGINVLTRLMGLVLAGVACQFILDSLRSVIG